MPLSTTSDHVSKYYDQNTQRFLRFGGSREISAIHRKIWAPGIKTSEQAFSYLNSLVAEVVTSGLPFRNHTRILDLGCGVGGTAIWLASRYSMNVVGITNSAVQQQIAVKRANRLGLSDRCQFIIADFMDLPPLDPVHAAFAIESFVHARNPISFFQETGEVLIKAGRLVICDDFLAGHAQDTKNHQRRLQSLKQFQNGWHIENFLTTEQVIEFARLSRFRLFRIENLSYYIQTYPEIILRAFQFVANLPIHLAYWENLSGGTALQICLRNGWSRYQAITFIKE